MPDGEPSTAPQSQREANDFVTTRWSIVLSAREGDANHKAEAMAVLCQTYWYPLYAYVRRRGYEQADAQDLTQEFFARLLSQNFLAAVRRERGKFRWFLLSAIKRFMINEHERSTAQKRGGVQPLLSLDAEMAEGRYRSEPVDHASPDKLFDRTWAMTVLEQARRQIESEYRDSGRHAVFDQLKVYLSGDRAPISQAEAAAALGMSEGAVKVAVHRLRHRYRDCLRGQIAQTVSSTVEIDEEIQQLFAAFE